MSNNRRSWRLWQQDVTVQEYLKLGDETIPARHDQLQVMLSLIPFPQDHPLFVLDLGCGDGILLETILRAFPQSQQAVALDGSPHMIERAVERLCPYGRRVHYVLANLDTADWVAQLPSNVTYHVVVSSLAIHHLDDARKQEVYQQVFGLLTIPGIFINIEHVKSHSKGGEALFEAWFVAHQAERVRAKGEQPDVEALLHAFSQRPGKQANQLAPVETQMEWLRAIGFTEVDCYWKFYELAIFAGCRS